MNLCCCCITVNPGTLLTISAAIDILFSSSIVFKCIDMLLNPQDYNETVQNSHTSILSETLIFTVLGLLALVSLVSYFRDRNVTGKIQFIYYNVKFILLLIEIVFICLISLLLFPFAIFILLIFSPVFFSFSWNNQLKSYAENYSRSRPVIDDRLI